MSRRCSITNKGVQAGNKVSHSNRKSRRRFLPNLQNVTLLSDALGRNVYMRVATNTLRTIEINGGIDAYLLSTSTDKLAEEAQALKKQIKKAIANKG